MNNEELTRSIISLNQLEGLGRNNVRVIFEDVSDIDHIDYLDLLALAVKRNKLRRSRPIGDFLDAGEYADSVLFRCANEGVRIINDFEEDFPDALRFRDHPILVYCRGDLSVLSNPNRAAVIGTRHPNDAGRDFAYNAGKVLAENGYTVVSGLAEGCDRAGHTGCLDAGGKTVAFMPSNISSIIPKKNEDLAQRILDNGGLLVSEFSPFQTPNAEMYTTRDRLQAGCSNFVITSEFDANSGTVQTLTFASEFDKPVYTLDKLTREEDFTGFTSVENEGIKVNPVSCQALEKIIADSRIS